jgi:hypothetical protein
MRKTLITLAAAASALAVATPAAAQYYPAPPAYGQGGGFNFGYNNYGHVRALQARIDRVQRNIERLDRRDAIRERTAQRLRYEARSVEQRLRHSTRYGLSPYEVNDVERRVFNLERRVRTAIGRGWRNDYGMAGYNGYGYQSFDPYHADRDRDGRNDRWEDDQGRDRDGGRWGDRDNNDRRGDRDDD